MVCPLCKQTLQESNSALLCPTGHGALITGKLLSNIKEEASAQQGKSVGEDLVSTAKVISCPNCDYKMEKVDYNHTGVVIDTCTNCPYRWLDAGEIAKIKNYKPNMQPRDLLFLADFNAKLKNPDTTQEESNPKIPLFNTARVVASGNTRNTLGALTGMAFYGVITGMVKSRFLRVVIPVMLLIVALVYWLVIASF